MVKTVIVQVIRNESVHRQWTRLFKRVRLPAVPRPGDTVLFVAKDDPVEFTVASCDYRENHEEVRLTGTRWTVPGDYFDANVQMWLNQGFKVEYAVNPSAGGVPPRDRKRGPALGLNPPGVRHHAKMRLLPRS